MQQDDNMSMHSVLTIPQNADFLEQENINSTIRPKKGFNLGPGEDAFDDTISKRSAARSVQHEAVGLRSMMGHNSFFNQGMNNTSASNGAVGTRAKHKARVGGLMMDVIGETAGDAQDEYEASTAR